MLNMGPMVRLSSNSTLAWIPMRSSNSPIIAVTMVVVSGSVIYLRGLNFFVFALQYVILLANGEKRGDDPVKRQAGWQAESNESANYGQDISRLHAHGLRSCVCGTAL